MAVAAQFPDEELLRLGRGVCLIEMTDGSSGTGFHYGNGWVMSNAHVFKDVKDDETMHSMIPSATFTFLKGGRVEDDNYFKIIRSTEENRVVFGPRNRTAFIHHLHVNPDGKADNTKMDIAMIKLGKQCEEGQPEEDIKEEELLFKLQEPKVGEDKLKKEYQISPFVQSPPPDSKVNKEVCEKVKEVYGVHFAVSDNKKFVWSNIIKITKATNNAVPMIYNDNSKKAFTPGSSGCPVMIKEAGKYKLAGLNFAGNDETECALRWTGGIESHIGNKVGVSIIAQIGPYLAEKRHGKNLSDQISQAREERRDRQLPMYENMRDPNSESEERKQQEAENKRLTDHNDDVLIPLREGLVQIARDHQLTIYLHDEETIK